MMRSLEQAQKEYVIACDLARSAGVEHAQARVELLTAERIGDDEKVAIAALRSAYATKLWEMKCREQSVALTNYNSELVAEIRKQRRQDARDPSEEGYRLCFKPGIDLPEAAPFWLP